MSDLVERARAFAYAAHNGINHERKYTGEPYTVHLEEVFELVKAAGLGDEAQAAALLHDTIEDCNASFCDIELRFGHRVAATVWDLTDEPTRDGINREQRKRIDRQRLFAADADTQSIKCADMISNTSSIADHDPHFARTYLPEKRAALEICTKADQQLLLAAWESLRRAEEKVFGPLATLVD